MESGRTRKIFIVLVALLVAGVQFFTGPGYSGPFRGFVTGYAMDLLLPFSSYFLLVAAAERLVILRNWFVKVLVIFAVMSGAEVAQYFGQPIFGRTYDPWDFVCYLAGALIAAGLDRTVLPRLFAFWSDAEAASAVQGRV